MNRRREAIDAGFLALSVRLPVSLAAGGDSHKPRFSEVGLGSVSVDPFVFRKPCTNDLIVMQEKSFRDGIQSRK